MTEPSSFRSLEFWVALAIALIVKITNTAQLGPVKDITPIIVAGVSGGLNYGAHRGLVRSSLSTPSVLVPGENLNRWALSWRGGTVRAPFCGQIGSH